MNDFWINYLFPFLTIVCMIVLYFTVNNLLPSYFQEKGKNLATRDDISKITELVESVKYTFAIETEKLKANLSLLNNIHSGLVSEERNAIIDFNEKYFRWLNTLLDLSHNSLDDSNSKELEDQKRVLGNLYQDLLNSEARFTLFVENEELVDHALDMKIETLQRLSRLPIKCIFSFLEINLEIEQMYKVTPAEEQIQKHGELLQRKSQALDEFGKTMIQEYNIVAPMARVFQKMCRDHIYKLIKLQEETSI